MNKQQFQQTLKKVIKHPTENKTAPCRCADCYNERQKNQRKTEGASSK